MISINHIDHLVLTVTSIESTIHFYQDVLGLEVISFGENRQALKFGCQKFNLHPVDHPLSPHAKAPVPGSEDFCLICDTPIDEIIHHLQAKGIAIEVGPVERTGALSRLRSVYIRDPDGNLVELANEIPT